MSGRSTTRPLRNGWWNSASKASPRIDPVGFARSLRNDRIPRGSLRMPHPDSQPTKVRYGVMGYLCSLAFILYIDRICIGQAGTAMQAELGLSNSQWGL